MVGAAEMEATHWVEQRGSRPVKPLPTKSVAGLTAALEQRPEFAELKSAADSARSERAEQLRRYLEESRQWAADESARSTERLARLMDHRRDLLGERPEEPDGIAPWVPEFTPVSFVKTTPGGSLHDFDIGGNDPWAKWSATVENEGVPDPNRAPGPEKVSFFHLWQNSQRRPVLIDVSVGLTASGHLSAEADGGGFAGWLFGQSAIVDVTAELTIWPIWDPEARDTEDSKPLGSASAKGGFFGDSSGQAINQAVTVEASGIRMPSQRWVLIEASIAAELTCADGKAVADFATADAFRVGCPWCLVTVRA